MFIFFELFSRFVGKSELEHLIIKHTTGENKRIPMKNITDIWRSLKYLDIGGLRSSHLSKFKQLENLVELRGTIIYHSKNYILHCSNLKNLRHMEFTFEIEDPINRISIKDQDEIVENLETLILVHKYPNVNPFLKIDLKSFKRLSTIGVDKEHVDYLLDKVTENMHFIVNRLNSIEEIRDVGEKIISKGHSVTYMNANNIDPLEE